VFTFFIDSSLNTFAVATLAALSLASLGAGYLLGARSKSVVVDSVTPTPPEATPAAAENIPSTETSKPQDADSEDDEEDEDIADGDLSAISAGFMEPCKMVCLTNLGRDFILMQMDRSSLCGRTWG